MKEEIGYIIKGCILWLIAISLFLYYFSTLQEDDSIEGYEYEIEELCNKTSILHTNKKNNKVIYFYDCDTYLEIYGGFVGYDSIQIDDKYKLQIKIQTENLGEVILPCYN